MKTHETTYSMVLLYDWIKYVSNRFYIVRYSNHTIKSICMNSDANNPDIVLYIFDKNIKYILIM